MLKTNFNKFSGNSKEDTYKIIIDNEGSRSRVNQPEKFKANQQKKKKFKQYQASAAEP